MMPPRVHTPDLYVLDSLANDIEDLEGILRMLNSDTALGWRAEWGREFEREEIVQALTRLTRADLVRTLVLAGDGKSLQELPARALPPESYDSAYFCLTERGRMKHTSWDPALPDPPHE